METNDNNRKVPLEELSRDDLLKKCRNFLIIAQKAKQIKDQLQEENNELKSQLNNIKINNNEIIEKLTQEKLKHVTIIDDLKNQLKKSNQKHDCDNEKSLLKHEIEQLNGQLNELNRISIEQRQELLDIEEKNREFKELQLSLDEKEKTIEKLKEKLKFYHTKIVKFIGDIKELKNDKNAILYSFKDYLKQVEDWKFKLQRLLNTINLIEINNNVDELNRIRIENKHLKDENNGLLKDKQRLVEKYEREIQVFNDQNRNNTTEIQRHIEENEKICIEYRKIISKLENDIEKNFLEMDELKQKNRNLQEELENFQKVDKDSLNKTNEEILKLIQENSDLIKSRDQIQEELQQLKRENNELLAEMNEMNQILKERGEMISELQDQLQNFERNSKEIVNKNEKIVEKTHEIAEKDENCEETETMSTSTISKTEEMSRLKDLESSWEERYGKLRTFAIKLKSKIRDLQQELVKEQNEKNEIQKKFIESLKNIDNFQDLQDKLADNESVIQELHRKLDEYEKEKSNTENWKKEISNKVQILRKELETKKNVEVKLENLQKDLDNKQKELVDLENLLEIKNVELLNNKKQFDKNNDIFVEKDEKISNLEKLLENSLNKIDELQRELTKIFQDNERLQKKFQDDKQLFVNENFNLKQSLKELQERYDLKNVEFEKLFNDYENYKIRAQSVLLQKNQNSQIGLEEKLNERIELLTTKCEQLTLELNEFKENFETVERKNTVLNKEKDELLVRNQELISEMDELKNSNKQLTDKHQQIIIENNETVRNLKIHAETLAQCYRQQLSELESRHNREISELRIKIESNTTPIKTATNNEIVENAAMPPREEGEGSESVDSNINNFNNKTTNLYPIPLERLLNNDDDNTDVDGGDKRLAFVKKQLHEEELKVKHLTSLLSDTEQDLIKHVQMNKLLKEEIRRQQRSEEREKHAENLEYLKNVVFKFVTLNSGDERSRLVPVLNTILKLSPEETHRLQNVARGDERGWSNYLPIWSSPTNK